MFADYYAQNPLLFWPLVGLAIFVVSFTAVLLYVFVGLREKSKVDQLAALPFEPDPEPSVESRDASVAGGGV
jgi:hypothetical protein